MVAATRLTVCQYPANFRGEMPLHPPIMVAFVNSCAGSGANTYSLPSVSIKRWIVGLGASLKIINVREAYYLFSRARSSTTLLTAECLLVLRLVQSHRPPKHRNRCLWRYSLILVLVGAATFWELLFKLARTRKAENPAE